MKSNLQILIDHFQAEYDYLKSSMDTCIAEWDFEGAKALREPVIYTRGKLNALKSLENPNYKRLTQLKGMVSNVEIAPHKRKVEEDYLDKETRQKMEEYFLDIKRRRNKRNKIEFEELQSIVPEFRIDDDTILELLEGLERNEINAVEFEIKKDKIFLRLSVHNEHAELAFRTSEKVKLSHYLFSTTKTILSKLGFNSETFTKQISNYKTLDKIRILEELAIIYFEVFGIFGEEVNVEISYTDSERFR